MRKALIQDDTWTARRKKQGYKIPGGWVMPISEWSVDREREDHWTAKLMPVHAHDPAKARKDARSRIDRFGRRYEMEMTIRMVKDMASMYAKKFPDLIQPDRSLAGFDPSLASTCYMPYRTPPGRDGSPEIRSLLEGMATRARKVAA